MTRLSLESPVVYADGAIGELADVVIDPRARRLTHLVVQPRDRHDLARLVPAAGPHVEVNSDGSISLGYTVAEITELEPVHTSDYVRLGERPAMDPSWDIGIEAEFELPLVGGGPLEMGIAPVELDPHATISYDRIPKGTVELRRASGVTSADGHHVGHVVGVDVDARGQVRQLVLEHGHLWGKREQAIPIGSVDRIESDEVVLNLSHDQV
jgi:sporulation protein YlmC with PRC-barrel domain